MEQFIVKQIGKIDETGYLKSFKRQGFTPAKCILELVANSLDSLEGFDHKCIHFDVSDNIKMIDNGIGMNIDGVDNMFALHRENHTSDKSRGVSGYGAKVSLSILSNEKDVSIYTHKKGGDYIKVFIPWKTIHEKGQYTGMIQVERMNQEERIAFRDERIKNNMIAENDEPIGTSIVFPYNDCLYETIRYNFLTKDDNEEIYLKPLDLIKIVFGREENVIISCTLPDWSRTLELYNYFGGRDIDYWGGIMKGTLELWSHKNENRFIWKKTDGSSWEIHKSGGGFAKKFEPSRKNTKGFTHLGDYDVKIGLRKQGNINPKTVTGGKIIGEYDFKFVGDNDEYLASHKLVRNSQGIGLIPPETKISNLRANAEQNFEIAIVQCDVCFSPTSAQDNKQDQITGIQQNKNQFDGASLPKNFTRAIHGMKMEKSKEILKLFETPDENDDTSLEQSQEENDDTSSEEQTEFKSSDTFTQMQMKDNKSVENEVEQERQDTELESTIVQVEDNTVLESALAEEKVSQNENKEVQSQELQVDSEESAELIVEDIQEKSEEKPVENKLCIPIDVKGHRKGCVLGHEFRDLFINILSSIQDDKVYSDPESIEFFNKMRHYKF